jgi:hypothetical protein
MFRKALVDISDGNCSGWANTSDTYSSAVKASYILAEKDSSGKYTGYCKA